MISVFLLLGSNLGDRQLYIKQAVSSVIKEIAPVEKASSLYETEAWGVSDQPNYINQVIVVRTDLSADDVLAKILKIELTLGRNRGVKWSARTIDIDILFYGNEMINEPYLEVPHPRLHVRRFTVEPLAELEPQMVHPVLKKTIAQLKNELKDNLIVKKL